MKRIVYTKFSNERAEEFNIRTDIVVDRENKKSVIKTGIGNKANEHVKNMKRWYDKLNEAYSNSGIKMCRCYDEKAGVKFEYAEGKNVSNLIDGYLKNCDTESINKCIDKLHSFLLSQSEKKLFLPSEKYTEIFGDDSVFKGMETDVIRPANIDLIFENIIVNNDEWTIIDYEWIFDIEVPVKYILYRSLFYDVYNGAYKYEDESKGYYERVGISEDQIRRFEQMENNFQSYVQGKTHQISEYYKDIIDIKDMLVKKPWEERELNFQIYDDKGGGFREENSYRKRAELKDGRFEIKINIDKETKKLRIDPGDYPILFDYNSELRVESSNGTFRVDNMFYFETEDPWIIVDVEDIKEPYIELRGTAGKLNDLSNSTVKNLYYENVQVKQELSNKENILQEKESELQKTINENLRLQNEINAMVNSLSWRLTGGLRKLSALIKKKEVAEPDEREHPDIAVHVHLFYTDLLEEFLEYFSNIPYPFDLYISCVKGADTKQIKAKACQLSRIENVYVNIFKNQGRDIAPFYVGFGERLSGYKYLLHVHSKKSKHIEAGGAEWRQYSLNGLVGSTEIVSKIFEKFEGNEKIGLIYPDCHPEIPMIGYTWMGNRAMGQQVLNELGIKFSEGLFNYPAGSFFWVKTDAIRKLFNRGYQLSDFPKEAGQIDGTLAHALERAIVFAVNDMGYHSYIIDMENDIMRKDISIKPYYEYLNMTQYDARERLMSYDTVSFGVFDTLIEFLPVNLSDVVLMVKERFGFNDDFVSYRIQAEQIARAGRGHGLTILDIYNVFTAIAPFDSAAAEEIRKAEEELLLANVIPRKDVRELYRYLKENGKEIVIICDSFYMKDTIEAALVKCGYIGFDKIWLSSELGIDKSDDLLWKSLYMECPSKGHIHVGSNVYTDWYMLERMGTASMWLMSPFEAYKLSKEYNRDKDYANLELEESISLGTKIKQELYNSAFGLIDKIEV